MATITKIIGSAVTNLNPRQKEVLTARFGLAGEGDGETLAAIGDRLNVTRERIRQIENSAMALAKVSISKNEEAIALLAKVSKYIVGKGGVAGKGDVVAYAGTLAKGIRETQLDFLAEASGAFQARREDEEFLPLYAASEKDWKSAKSFVDGWVGNLRSNQENVFAGSYRTELASFIKNKALANPIAENFLGLSKQIGVNPYGDYGLQEWPEINPKTVRDKIYLVLKKKGEPLHFESIAKHINDVGFEGTKALAPTVHNELIKDKRFVLVGRGMYGLGEQGYEPGIAREVIAKVLKERGPLYPKDVVNHVVKQRFFKPNTIVINLQNKSLFERLPDGKYQVREA
jgi:hypothetical protein